MHARKCLVKNVLKEEDLRPPPSLASLLAASQISSATEGDALMPTIHIGSLRELALKLPGPCYPTDAPAGPATPTTPVMLAHDASYVLLFDCFWKSG